MTEKLNLKFKMVLTLLGYNLKFNNCYFRNYTETLAYYLDYLTCLICVLVNRVK